MSNILGNPRDLIRCNRVRLSSLLRSFRERYRLSRRNVVAQITGALASDGGDFFSHSPFTKEAPSTEKRATAILVELESTKKSGDLPLTVDELEVVANAYGIPRLMLDPVISQPTTAPCLIDYFDDFVQIGKTGHPEHETEHPEHETGHPEHLGYDAIYSIPRFVLSETEDVAFVHLTLQRSGHSASHQHPGSELIFVLRGSVEVRLEDGGMRTRLDRGDYIHFDSEEQHSAWNAAPTTGDAVGDGEAGIAEMFIVRFYQLKSARHRRGSTLRKALATPRRVRSGRRPPIAHAADRGAHEINFPFDLDANAHAGKDVLDRAGLGRLLSHIAAGNDKTSRRTLRDLERIAKEKNLKDLSRSKIDRLQRGLSPVKSTDLPKIAELYGVQPFLFQSFLYPSVRGAVSVRVADLANVPEAYVSPGMSIRVPRRTLIDSGIAIVLVELEPGKQTPVNRHPGHELILPLRGTIEVRFGTLAQALSLKRPGYAHYHSTLDHCIANTGKTPAEFLVIRFHEA